jgi:Tripartite tricarboxylate transporter TctB family
MKRADYLPALALWVITALYLAMAYQYKPAVRAFPAGVAWIMLVLLSLDLVSRTETEAGRMLTRWLNPATQAREAEPPARQVSAVIGLASFAALIVLAGILAAVPLYLFGSLRWRARKSYRACVLGAAGATLFVWLLFSVVLRIALYPGLLFGGA